MTFFVKKYINIYVYILKCNFYAKMQLVYRDNEGETEMPSSLGIYIEDNLIKYAKVVKEKDSIKVEAFNVVFYDNLAEALNKIINETYSFKIPICINVSNELYNYFDIFSQLNKSDIKKSIDIEFEMLCNDKKYNINSLETRHILMNNKENTDKIRALHIAVNKADISKKQKDLSGNKVVSMAPISTSITNLIDVNPKNNIAIINIENETKITTIVDGQINRVDTLEYGMGKILREINKTENSMQKSYDLCKNVTIYTQETQVLQSEENEHLEDIMPELYKLVTESKKIIDSSFSNISKVYITGLGAVINNIDLYFQEYMVNVKCEILKPFFIESSSVKISVKDYIEVNSAIALAMDGLDYGNKELNFATKVPAALKEINLKKPLTSRKNINFSLSGKFDKGEKLMLRLASVAIIFIISYMIFAINTMNQISSKTTDVRMSLSSAQTEIKKVQSDYAIIQARTSTYESLIDSINNLSNSNSQTENQIVVPKDAIPNLLNRIMFVIPKKVQITSIKNTKDRHIVIEAQSEKYEQLGYFKAVLDTKGILVDVKSTSGMKDNGLVKVTIEGDLP